MTDVEYQRLQPDQEQEAIHFFYDTFVRDEGQLVSVGAGSNAKVSQFMEHMLGQGVSLVARKEGVMVGQLLSEVHRREGVSQEPPPSYPALLAQYQDPAWARFLHLGASRVLWPRDLFSESPSLGSVLDLGFLSVAREWRGRGVAGQLVRRGEGLARELGCQGMVMIAATTATCRIAEKMGMVRWRECRWQDYRDEEDVQVFNVPDEKGDRLISFVKFF